MKKMMIFGSLFLAVCTFGQSSKDRKVRELITLMQVDKLAMEGVKQMLNAYSTTQNDVPKEFWTRFEKEIKSEELIDLYIPIYSKHYTEEDIDGLISFYKSAVGKKWIAKTPDVMKDSMEAGKEWGQKIAYKMIEEVGKAKGYSSPPPPMPAKNIK